jgi:hypothetical protein
LSSTLEDLWQLEVDDPEWLTTIIDRFLSVGVPPTAISKALYLDVQVVKDRLIDDRISHYGTAELGEAMHALMWRAYEDLLTLIDQAPLSKRIQINMTLLSKASALVGSQTPDGIARMQAELEEVMSEQRQTPTPVSSSIYELDPVDAPPDDPEEGSTGRTT